MSVLSVQPSRPSEIFVVLKLFIFVCCDPATIIHSPQAVTDSSQFITNTHSFYCIQLKTLSNTHTFPPFIQHRTSQARNHINQLAHNFVYKHSSTPLKYFNYHSRHTSNTQLPIKYSHVPCMPLQIYTQNVCTRQYTQHGMNVQ